MTTSCITKNAEEAAYTAILLMKQGVFGGQKRETGGAPSLYAYNTFAPKLEGRCIGKADDFVSPNQKDS